MEQAAGSKSRAKGPLIVLWDGTEGVEQAAGSKSRLPYWCAYGPLIYSLSLRNMLKVH